MTIVSEIVAYDNLGYVGYDTRILKPDPDCPLLRKRLSGAVERGDMKPIPEDSELRMKIQCKRGSFPVTFKNLKVKAHEETSFFLGYGGWGNGALRVLQIKESDCDDVLKIHIYSSPGSMVQTELTSGSYSYGLAPEDADKNMNYGSNLHAWHCGILIPLKAKNIHVAFEKAEDLYNNAKIVGKKAFHS